MEPNNGPAQRPSRYRSEPDWSSLSSRIFEDVTRVIHVEFRLIEANMSRVLIALVDRALGQILLICTLMAGGLCLLAALIAGLHTMMPWWAAFAIGGVVAVVPGLAGFLYFRHAAERAESGAATRAQDGDMRSEPVPSTGQAQ